MTSNLALVAQTPTPRRSRPRQGPRSVLAIVKALGLDDVHVPDKNKTRNALRRQTRATSPVIGDGPIVQSSRNNTLTSIAGSMRRQGTPQAALEAALQAINIERCQPPLDRSEVSGIVASIMRYPASDNEEILKSLNDAGNAARLQRRFSEAIRYVPELKRWLVWKDTHWEPDHTGQLVEMAKEVGRAIYSEASQVVDDHVRASVVAHARASLQAPRIKNMIELAQSLPELVVPVASLDTDPMLLGVLNGVVDLRKGTLLKATRDMYITRQAPALFHADAACPRFERFIAETMGHDKALQSYLRRVAGYCLTGLTTEQCLFFLYGHGANGKSTFLNVIKHLLGHRYAVQTPTETLMVRRAGSGGANNDIARLDNMRVVIANEVEESSLLAESLIKQLTGGDSVSARFLYGEHFDFIPKLKLLIAGNHKPVIRGEDDGIWRRIQMIPFEHTVAPSRRDKRLESKLKRELSGILNWFLAGCKEWAASGLKPPKVITDAVSAYRGEMDILSQWLTESCVLGPQLEWPARAAYSSYADWAVANGFHPMTSAAFGRRLAGRFKRVERSSGRWYQGIAAKPVVPPTGRRT